MENNFRQKQAASAILTNQGESKIAISTTTVATTNTSSCSSTFTRGLSPLPVGWDASPSPCSPASPYSDSSGGSSSDATARTSRSKPGSGEGKKAALTPVRKPRKKPAPRKGHTKSRNGCFSCKRRKVKCQENLPECYNCKRIGLPCSYPTPSNVHVPMPTAAKPGNLQGSGSGGSSAFAFTLEDMRFFHHFLFTTYPPLPIAGAEVWHNVGQLSHRHDFLTHALLGLAASHLTLSTGADYSSQALQHRVTAVRRLNDALSTPCRSGAEGDARYGTTMALAIQSTYMPDGMLDFIRMMRGCSVVARTAVTRSLEESMFGIVFSRSGQNNVRAGGGGGSSFTHGGGEEVPLDEEVVQGYLAAVRALAPLCLSVTEVAYMGAIEKTMRVARQSPLEARDEFVRMWVMSNEMGNEEFAALTDPSNHGGRLLLVHVYLCEHVLSQAYLEPLFPASHQLRKDIVSEWLKRVVEPMPEKLRKHADWGTRFLTGKVYSPPQDGASLQGGISGMTGMTAMTDMADMAAWSVGGMDGIDGSTNVENSLGSPANDRRVDSGDVFGSAMEVDDNTSAWFGDHFQSLGLDFSKWTDMA